MWLDRPGIVRGQVFKFHFWPREPPLTPIPRCHSNRRRTSFVRPKMKFEDLTPALLLMKIQNSWPGVLAEYA